jgi:hypothetical protein
VLGWGASAGVLAGSSGSCAATVAAPLPLSLALQNNALCLSGAGGPLSPAGAGCAWPVSTTFSAGVTLGILAANFAAYQWVLVQFRDSNGNAYWVTWSGASLATYVLPAGQTSPLSASAAFGFTPGSRPVIWLSLVVGSSNVTSYAYVLTTAGSLGGSASASVAFPAAGGRPTMQNVSFANTPGGRVCLTEAWVYANNAVTRPSATAKLTSSTWANSLVQAPFPPSPPPLPPPPPATAAWPLISALALAPGAFSAAWLPAPQLDPSWPSDGTAGGEVGLLAPYPQPSAASFLTVFPALPVSQAREEGFPY